MGSDAEPPKRRGRKALLADTLRSLLAHFAASRSSSAGRAIQRTRADRAGIRGGLTRRRSGNRDHRSPVPSAEAQEAGWIVKVIAGELEYSGPLIADLGMSSQDGMVRCNSFGDGLLAKLTPGLYEVEITVFQGSRAKVDERFLYWAGLR